MESTEAEVEALNDAEDSEEKMRQKLEARKHVVEGTEQSEASQEPGGREDVKLPAEAKKCPDGGLHLEDLKEDIPITPPTFTPATSEGTAAVASSSSSSVQAPQDAKVFRMDDDDDEAVSREHSPNASFQGMDGAGSAAVVPPGSEMGLEVRRRFRFLSAQDQKTTVKRECQLASKREEALIAHIQQTIASYLEALELSRVCERLPDGLGPTLSREVAEKYKERIEFLRGTLTVLEGEPNVCLPKMGALEQTKGLAFAAYAQTASSLKIIGDDLGLSQPAGRHGSSDSYSDSPVTIEDFINSSTSNSTTGPAVGTTTY
mmetsp:Transcript_88222/g.139428  ORF Transcript_88222/g.139428 Transcript_88222/m.139428 type:complete len:318 (+) Transcript_88222:69-1022(+)